LAIDCGREKMPFIQALMHINGRSFEFLLCNLCRAECFDGQLAFLTIRESHPCNTSAADAS
jgi:hypothetical protein